MGRRLLKPKAAIILFICHHLKIMRLTAICLALLVSGSLAAPQGQYGAPKCEKKRVAQPISYDCQQDQECKTSYEEECQTKYEQQCDTKYEEKCELEYEDKCETKYEEQCEVGYAEQCETKYEQQCRTEYDEQCETKYEQKCETGYEEQCETKYEEQCETKYDTEYEQQCETKYDTTYEDQCETKYEQQCETKYETQCETKYEEQCETKYETQYEQQCETKYEQQCETKYEDQRLRRAGQDHRHQEGRENLASSVHQASVGLPQGEGSPGSPEQAVVHPQRHHGTHLRNREDQVFQHVQVPEGPPHHPRQINEEPDQSDIANYSDFNFPIFDLIN